MNNQFGYPEFTPEGVRVLTTTDGTYRDMMMNITVYRMQAGQSRRFHLEQQELAVLLLSGGVTFAWADQTRRADRPDCFERDAFVLHVCRDTPVDVTAHSDSEILVQSTENPRAFDARYYRPEDIDKMVSGRGVYGGKATRRVTTVFDYHSAPYSNMVLGEVFAEQGGWSSYLPHSHPQPEVYYYRFDKPQGFGACFIGEDVYKITDGSFSAIPGGLTHPQVAAPGYRMMYVWMIRHFDGNPWTDRIDDPQHLWILDETFETPAW